MPAWEANMRGDANLKLEIVNSFYLVQQYHLTRIFFQRMQKITYFNRHTSTKQNSLQIYLKVICGGGKHNREQGLKRDGGLLERLQ